MAGLWTSRAAAQAAAGQLRSAIAVTSPRPGVTETG
jgi:hypothetical protein